MKREFGCILLFLLLLLCGCTTNVERRLMRSGLDSINQCNRNSLPFTIEDVQPYVRFFDKHGTANDKMLAHYLLGRAYHEDGDSPMALECYQHAIESADTADTHCDFSQLSRVYAQKAAIFFYQDLYRQQIEHLKQSVRYAWMAHDTLAALMSYEQEALSYERIGKSDSSIYIIEDVAAKFEEYGHSSDAAISLGLAVGMLMDKGDYQKAKRYMDLYESKSGYFDSQKNIETGREIYYKEKGMYYLNTNRLDSAEYYFRKELHDGLDYNNKNAAAMGLALLYEKQHRSDSVAKYALYAYAMNDSLCAHKVTSTVEQIQSLYNYTRHQEIAKKERERAAREKSKWEYSLLLLLLLGFSATLIIYRMNTERKKQKMMYAHSLDIIEQTQSELLLLRSNADHYEELIAEKEQQLEKLLQEIQNYKGSVKRENNVADKHIRESAIYQSLLKKQGKKLSILELRECHRLIIENLPQLNSLLLSKQYKLNEKEFNVCILFRLGFKSKEVSNMLDVTQGRISQICSNVLLKVFEQNTGGASDLIERLHLLC